MKKFLIIVQLVDVGTETSSVKITENTKNENLFRLQYILHNLSHIYTIYPICC